MIFKLNPQERNLINIFGEATNKNPVTGDRVLGGHELLHNCKNIKLNGVEVEGDTIYIGGNLVTVGFVETSDTFYNGEPVGKSYSIGKVTAELWNTTSNPQGLWNLYFERQIGTTNKIRTYHFILRDSY